MSKFVEKYFSILKDYFGVALERIYKKGYSVQERPRAIAEVYDATLFKPMLESLYDELMRLDWVSQEDAVRKIGGVKTSYIGSLYMSARPPETSLDFLKKMCLYSDTLILNDHTLSELITWRRRGTGESLTFLIVATTAIDYLTVEDLFISDVHPPPCTLAPPLIWSLEKSDLASTVDHFINESKLSFASDVFGRDFLSSEELVEFLSKMKDFNHFISLAEKPEMVTTLEGNPFSVEDLQTFKSYYKSKYFRDCAQNELLEAALRARFAPPMFKLMSDGKFTSNFTTDFRGIWETLKWLLRNNNETAFEHLKEKLISKDNLIMNALQQKDLRWLGNIPLDKIGQLKEKGELQELRELIGKNVQDIKNATDEEFAAVGRQVKYNLDEAFRKHDAEVKDLNEKYRRKYGIDVASLIVSGSLGIVSALFPPIALATGIASGIVGSGSIIGTAKDFLEKREKLRDLQKKPVAMLFDARQLVT